ncbi:MAG: SDR family oxidoreductase [Pirellulales bacterium]|nr:SDR family oxidoreductase [Pirellulales bacterium]
MSAEFVERVALVTGGSRGIGRATALRLAGEGADVAISYASRAAEAAAVVREIEGLGRRALAVRCDVSQDADIAELVAQTRAVLGPIAFLAHCGAISNLASHLELSPARWREMIDVNLTGAYLTVFAVKDEMLAHGFGRIVLVSSIAALLPRRMQIHYAAAKAGVMALARCCADAFAEGNVRVNCLAPGLVETEMAHVLSEERIRDVLAATPMGRIGQPEEIAGTIRFLLSNDSSYMTGQTIVASGGRHMMT